MRITLFIAVFFSLFVVALFAFGLYATDHFTGSVSGTQRFTVVPNENALALGERLEKSGIIFSRYTFLWYLVREEKTRKIIAGEYLLSGDLTTPEIALVVTSGKTVSSDIKVTFPEGWTMAKMADRLTANKLPGKEFLALAEKPLSEWRTQFDFLKDVPVTATLEGFLFPDTYLFDPAATATDIVEAMLQNFGKKFDVTLRQGVKSSPHSFFELVTLASIIEEEGRTKEERDMISDVFWKRIAIGQPLQSDATVNYVHGTTRLQPTFQDIDSDSPYNTYKHAGLPPGPISNPSLMSIRAAIYPKANPYFYFLVSAKTKETVYSVTFEEHVRNRSLHGL
ncbi:MAG: endolytic transglycosylase MltG [Candidatus Moranbacteria bacterium]|nr:endolytic transglycosylase MltG [Candidatus Moranbacteria bacterium]